MVGNKYQCLGRQERTVESVVASEAPGCHGGDAVGDDKTKPLSIWRRRKEPHANNQNALLIETMPLLLAGEVNVERQVCVQFLVPNLGRCSRCTAGRTQMLM